MAGQVILSANDASPVTALGSTFTDFDLDGLLGPRSYVYVRNQDSSAWSAGLSVRQRSDLFATEGSALTGDANTVRNRILDASAGAPLSTAKYIPDSIDRALYWQASASPTSTYYGKIDMNTATELWLEDIPAAAITNSGAYIAWRPYVFVKSAIDDTLSVGGITQSTISTLYHGWVQYGGFGYGYVLGGDNDDDVGNGLGVIPGSVAGMGNGVTAGTDPGYVYAYSMTDEAASEVGVYVPLMIVAPYMHRYPILP